MSKSSMLSLAEALQKSMNEELDAIEKAKAQLKCEREAFEEEKAVMNKLPTQGDQIVELNIGGENITTHRSTLCAVQGSMLAAMFSGRWEEQLQKDKDGRYFLDHDPYCVRKIIDFLRSKKIEDPDDPMPLPIINPEKKNEFSRIVKYLGLVEMFTLQLPPGRLNPDDVTAVATVNPQHLESVRSERCLTLTYRGPGSHYFVRSQNLMQVGTMWKIRVVSLNGWMLLGSIVTQLPGVNSYTDPTCCAWATDNQSYASGRKNPDDDWTEFLAGDTAIFRLEENSLRLVLRRASEQQTTTWSIPRGSQTGPAYVHVNFHATNTSIQLQPVTAEDAALFS
jgi:hypothetical protein